MSNLYFPSSGTPLWPFGFGLSYSTFRFAWAGSTASSSTAVFSTAELTAGAVFVTFNIKNAGTLYGAKTVQAFVRSLSHDALNAPVGGSLFFFKKLALSPGQDATVELPLSANSVGANCPFCLVATDGSRAVRSGDYELFLGATRDLTMRITVHGPVVARPLF